MAADATTPSRTSGGAANVAAARPSAPPSTGELLRHLLVLAWPTSLLYLSYLLSQTVLFAFCGNLLDSASFQAVGVGIASMNLFGYNAGMGFVAALDTLCSQEYGRDKVSPKLGVFLKLSLLMNAVAATGLGAFLTFLCAPYVLKYVMASPDVARNVSCFLSPSAWFLFFSLSCLSLAKFSQAQRVPWIPCAATVVGAVTIAPLLWFLVGTGAGDLTLVRVALSLACSTGIQLGVSLLLVSCAKQTRRTLRWFPSRRMNKTPATDSRRSAFGARRASSRSGSGAIERAGDSEENWRASSPPWSPPSVLIADCDHPGLQRDLAVELTTTTALGKMESWEEKAFVTRADVRSFLRVGALNVLLVGGESMAFNILNVASGHLTQSDSAAFLIATNLANLFFALVFGPACALGTLVGNALGNNDPATAKRIAHIGLVVITLIACANGVIFLSFRSSLVQVYTRDPAIVAAFDTIRLVFPFFHLTDCLQYAFQGVYGGTAQNAKGAGVMLGVMWGVTVPVVLGVVFFRPEWGVLGMIGAFTVGLAHVAATFFVVMTRTFDWTALAAKASKDQQHPSAAPAAVHVASPSSYEESAASREVLP